jgi:hypothetical protein
VDQREIVRRHLERSQCSHHVGGSDHGRRRGERVGRSGDERAGGERERMSRRRGETGIDAVRWESDFLARGPPTIEGDGERDCEVRLSRAATGDGDHHVVAIQAGASYGHVRRANAGTLGHCRRCLVGRRGLDENHGCARSDQSSGKRRTWTIAELVDHVGHAAADAGRGRRSASRRSTDHCHDVVGACRLDTQAAVGKTERGIRDRCCHVDSSVALLRRDFRRIELGAGLVGLGVTE